MSEVYRHLPPMSIDVYEHKTSRLQSFGGRMIQQGLYGGRHGELA